jgi:hypothetical protein
MSRTLLRCLASLALLYPNFALAQPDSPKLPPAGGPDQSVQMYEDIEIMRRLLNEKLAGSTGVANLRASLLLNASCTQCHGRNGVAVGDIDFDGRININQIDGWRHLFLGAALVDFDRDGKADLFLVNPLNNTAAPTGKQTLDSYFRGTANYLNQAPNASSFPKLNESNFTIYNAPFTFATTDQPANSLANFVDVHRLHAKLASPVLDAEGTYLRGHGIVYTLTLPPLERDPRPQAPSAPPKPVSDWDRIRREIRKEKPAAEAEQKPKEPTLGDVVIKLLAENGKHFSHLGPSESLTVAITFRPEANRLLAILDPHTANAETALRRLSLDLFGTLPQPNAIRDPARPNGTIDAKPAPKEDPNQLKTAASGTASTPQDYALLGDLHLKQGKPAEAFKAYLKALELNTDSSLNDVYYGRVQRAYAATPEKPTEMEIALKKAALRLGQKNPEQVTQPKMEKPSEPKAANAPAKLVITACKQHLDEVGSGKISLEEFKKKVIVEYVTLPAGKK